MGPTIFAQTGQLGPTPDVGELKKKAAKAIDKDDKKKMGSEKHAMFHKVKKILQGKNKKARDVAAKIEDVLSGRKEPEKPNNDETEKLKAELKRVQEELEAKKKAAEHDKDVSKEKLQELVKKLKEQMDKMK